MNATTVSPYGYVPVFTHGILPQFPLPGTFPCGILVEVVYQDFEGGVACFRANGQEYFCNLEHLEVEHGESRQGLR